MLRLVPALIAAFVLVGPAPHPAQMRQVAVTVDDLPTVSVSGDDIDEAERVTRELVASLVRNKVPAVGFVNERKLQPAGRIEPRRVALLQRWIDAGLELGNHTYSHLDLHRTAVAAFERDVLEGEKVTRGLLRRAGAPLRYFRHPFLHTGRDAETRRRIDAFLGAHGYRVAPVTIDNYDYTFAAAHERASGRSDRVALTQIVAAYLSYMEDVVAYYERQSLAILEREIPQILLLHASALNAATLDDIVRMFLGRGYSFVSLDRALKDPAHESADDYFGPAGMTWLHRWAITAGRAPAIFAGEPAVPEWIERAARDARQ